jgi:hypothetical protein
MMVMVIVLRAEASRLSLIDPASKGEERKKNTRTVGREGCQGWSSRSSEKETAWCQG